MPRKVCRVHGKFAREQRPGAKDGRCKGDHRDASDEGCALDKRQPKKEKGAKR